MEETKIWSIEDKSAISLNTTNQMETEGLLEDILTAHPDMLEEGLQLVGRQTSTAGGPLDLLGVDSDGRLVVFELKRGRLSRDAVAQVVDYASSLDAMDRDSLNDHIKAQSGNLGIQKIEDFDEWHSNNYPDAESLTPPRMVLVGLGVDDTTERMVSYLANSEMDISLLTFQGFLDSSGKTLLTRNVEVDRADAAASTLRKPRSRPRNRARFLEQAQTLPLDVKGVLDSIERMFRVQLSGYKTYYASTRMNFNFDYSWQDGALKNRAVLAIEIDNNKNGVKIVFYPPSIGLLSNGEFDKPIAENYEFKKASSTVIAGPEGIDHQYEMSFYSLEDWNARKDMLTELTQKVCKAYDVARGKALSSQ
jgi:hypothetical protein